MNRRNCKAFNTYAYRTHILAHAHFISFSCAFAFPIFIIMARFANTEKCKCVNVPLNSIPPPIRLRSTDIEESGDIVRNQVALVICQTKLLSTRTRSRKHLERNCHQLIV